MDNDQRMQLEQERRAAESPVPPTRSYADIVRNRRPPPQEDPNLQAQEELDLARSLEQASPEITSPSLGFSRACRVCLTKVPHRRAIFSCGHLACLACAEQMKLVAIEEKRKLLCPFCRKIIHHSRFNECTQTCEEDNRVWTARSAQYTAYAAHKDANAACGRAHSAVDRALQAENTALLHLNAALEAKKQAKSASQLATSAYGGSPLTALETAYAEGAHPDAAYEGLRSLAAEADARRTVEAAQNAYNLAAEKRELAREELRRVIRVASGAATAVQLAKDAVKSAELQLIDQLRKDNEKSAELECKYSRRCLCCDATSPRRRAFFANCGHVICFECAEYRATIPSTCLICKHGGSFVPLYEDQTE